MKEVGPKITVPPLDLKHMIWVLAWAREHCADAISKAELERTRHVANGMHPACTSYGYKERTSEMTRIDGMLAEHRKIYAWLDGAHKHAMTASAEEFGRDMAEMFKGRMK